MSPSPVFVVDVVGGRRSARAAARIFSLLFAVATPVVACSDDEPPDNVGPAECTNRVRDPGEEGIDCGGPCPRCDGASCAAGSDCASGSCTSSVCDPAAEKTCGVGLPAPCNDGETCQQDADCASDYCTATCDAPPANVHEDGRRNGGETGVDCGGTVRAERPCPEGQGCKSSDDCQGACNAQGLCDAPGPTDRKKNNGETDVDCGGPNAPKCALGKVCESNDDCELLACTEGACVVPTETDGVQNGGESDVDCGGPGVSAGGVEYKPPRCVDFKACSDDKDCVTGACSPAGRCVAPSCDTAETAGITTCGAKEVGDPTAVHESCCKSLPLPTRAGRRLDKYEVTAGRFRTFLTQAGPDLRKWVTDYVKDKPTSQLASMVASYPTLLQLYPNALKGAPRSLVAHMTIDIDNYGGFRGCYNGTGSFSANTYWMSKEDLTEFGLPERTLPRETTDAKSLNCVMPIMFVAFCAWDGGELATRADITDAWGAATYPWGSTDIQRPNYNWCNGNPGTGGFTCQNPAIGENGMFYRFPTGTDLANDMSPLIAAPGRFTMDATAAKGAGETWMDLYANLAEYTADFVEPIVDFCDFSAAPAATATKCTRPNHEGQGTSFTGIPSVRVIGASWEGHNYGRNATPPSDALPAAFQYGKFGARCVRPAQ